MNQYCSPARILILLFSFCLVSGGTAAENRLYLGQEPPGLTPKVFAPGFISLDNRYESFITFTPDGNECYFTHHQIEWQPCRIMMTVYRNGQWTTPQKASFSDTNSSLCPSITHDGTRLFFSKNASIYQSLRNEEGDWSTPVLVSQPVSSSSYEFSCHFSDKGNMFVCSWRSGGMGGCDGWRIPFVDGQWQQAQNLRVLNSSVGDCCFAPGPNEDYLIFQSRRPPTGNAGGFFGTDLFISFATPEGGWTTPRNLGPIINSPATDGFPWISHDGRYMFFASDRQGTNDIYWVETRAFLPDPNGPVRNLNTRERYNSIQAAAIFAQDGDVIVIDPDIYQESIDLTGKTLLLQSVDPNNPVYIGGTIIQGRIDNPVVILQSNSRDCEIAGLTIRAGSVGIRGTETNATICNCRIMDNVTNGMELFQSSSPLLKNCLITANGQTGIKMHPPVGRGMSPCAPTIESCIIVDNGDGAIDGGEPIIVNSTIED